MYMPCLVVDLSSLVPGLRHMCLQVLSILNLAAWKGLHLFLCALPSGTCLTAPDFVQSTIHHAAWSVARIEVKTGMILARLYARGL
jgi:hypothetical protein